MQKVNAVAKVKTQAQVITALLQQHKLVTSLAYNELNKDKTVRKLKFDANAIDVQSKIAMTNAEMLVAHKHVQDATILRSAIAVLQQANIAYNKVSIVQAQRYWSIDCEMKTYIIIHIAA